MLRFASLLVRFLGDPNLIVDQSHLSVHSDLKCSNLLLGQGISCCQGVLPFSHSCRILEMMFRFPCAVIVWLVKGQTFLCDVEPTNGLASLTSSKGENSPIQAISSNIRHLSHRQPNALPRFSRPRTIAPLLRCRYRHIVGRWCLGYHSGRAAFFWFQKPSRIFSGCQPCRFHKM